MVVVFLILDYKFYDVRYLDFMDICICNSYNSICFPVDGWTGVNGWMDGSDYKDGLVWDIHWGVR